MTEDTLPTIDVPDIAPEPPKDCRTCVLSEGLVCRALEWYEGPRVRPLAVWILAHDWTPDGFPIDTQHDCPEWVAR